MNENKEQQTQLTITGVIRIVTFRAVDTGFSIIKLDIEGHHEAVAVKGITDAGKGVTVTCDGAWVHDAKFGLQFVASQISTQLPTNNEGVTKYLSSGIIKGLGEKTAAKIVAHFGSDTMKMLDECPDRLLEVKGVKTKLIEKIKSGWTEQTAVRELMVFLQSHGISAALAFKIHKTYEGKALKVIQDNPWRLARDVNGIGFKSADEIALNLGKAKDCIERIQASLTHNLFEASSNGNCGTVRFVLLKSTANDLGLDVSLVEKAYQAEIESTTSSIVDDKGVAWLKYLYVAEEKIAKKLKKMISGKPSWTNIDIQESIAWVQFETGSVLAEQQKKAIEIQLSSRVMIVTGGPGCGKTFLLNSMLKILRGHGVNCLLTAPTGKAAVRMRESTGLRAKTIHRLLRLGKETSSNEVLDCDLLVIDEFSMVDVSLFVKVLEALPPHASILMVGDADQLPSVGAGATLWDMIASKAVPVVKLDKVFRQAEHSKIIQNAHKVNAGSMVSFGKPGEDFFFMSENDAEKIPGIIESLVAERLPARFGYDPVRDIQILCPSHRSSTGTVAMNALIQNRLNPNPVAEHTHFGIRYGVGDKVMQRVNNYDKDVFNGDAGVVIDIDVEASSAYVKFANESIVEYDFDELDELVLASAMTIHKSQGSDFPVVIIPVTTQHFMMLQRNLIYTGITRARKLCIIVGQQQALEMAIRNNKAVERITRLFGLLKVVEN